MATTIRGATCICDAIFGYVGGILNILVTLVILDLGVKRLPINLIRIGSLYVELVELDPKDDLELELESELELVGMGMCMGIADS